MQTTKTCLGIGLLLFATIGLAACGGAAPPPPAAPASTAPPVPRLVGSGVSVVTVELTSLGEENLALEIWNEAGRKRLASAPVGAPQVFEFKNHDPEKDFSAGDYTVVVALAHDTASAGPVRFELKVKKPDGSTQELRRNMDFPAGKNRWVAFRVEAAAGAVTDVDRFTRAAR